jgi:DNA mismatch repair protein MutS2
MDDHSLKVLEFYRILEILKEFSISPLGQKRCLALRPSKDLHSIQSRLAEVFELKEILRTFGDIPIRGLKDIEAALKRLEVEGAVLNIQEIMDIHQQMVLCKGIKRFFQKSEIKAPHLQEKVSKLSSLKALEKEILQAINTKGEILDRASPTLSDIRKRLRTVREKAKEVLEHLLHQEELQPIFQEHFITLRNGRYVLLVKFDYKHRLEGIIHDQSQSHMTLFFEPLQAITFNNEINILIGEEKEEEYRILSDLSRKMRDEIQSLWSDFEILGELDLLYAMAKLSILLKGVEPKLNEDGKVDIREAKNPLLMLQKESQVVPIHLWMRDGVKTLIISGANAGGKTVALKSLGLLTLMVQSGLLLPVAEGSQVAIFEDVFAAIGDEQNIGENLSTFSGHLLHVNQVLKKAGPRSLVLLDELGVGTHAQEGCALAMGFLDQFRESGASVVVTTHFDGLKAYGYSHPDVKNVAVEFDEETLEPKYTLSYGSSGLSNAFLVAEKLGISEKVLEMARGHRGGGAEEVSRALEKLERLKADAAEQRQQVLKIKEEVLQERQRLKDLIERIKRNRREILSQAEEKARRIAQEVEEELRAWVRKQKEEKTHFNIHHDEAIHKIRGKFFPSRRKRGSHKIPSGLKVGEHVRIESLRSNGVLLKVEEPLRRAEVMTERAKVKVPLTDIVKAMEGGEKKEKEISISQPLSRGDVQEVPNQLNVIGLTVEDALPIVDKFIDQALLHGLERVHIIHGIGSGRLRKAIGEFLYGHRGVKHFSPEEVTKVGTTRSRGGMGVTVVELR